MTVFSDPGTQEIRVQEVSQPALVRALAGIAIWSRFDAREKDWVSIAPPSRHATVLFNAANYVPLLKHVIVLIQEDGSHRNLCLKFMDYTKK